MKKLLLPVDGSDNALRAVKFALDQATTYSGQTEIHLLTVQLPIVSGDVRMFVSEESIKNYYHDEGIKVLASARAMLDAAGVHYIYHIGVGQIAETIAQYAEKESCDQIILGSKGHGAIAGLLLGSVATKVMHLVNIPVCLVK